MTKPRHMRPPGRPLARRSNPAGAHVNQSRESQGSREAEVANYDLIVALGKLGGPIKPPKRRQP